MDCGQFGQVVGKTISIYILAKNNSIIHKRARKPIKKPIKKHPGVQLPTVISPYDFIF
jgi:hypothetical protein